MSMMSVCTSGQASSSAFGRRTSVRKSSFSARSSPVCYAKKEVDFSHVPAVFLATIASASLLLAPLEAAAVSGGGGVSGPMNNVDMSGQDMRKMSFTKANLRQTNMSNTKANGVSFFGALAIQANFSGADLTGASMESGDFKEVNFENAVLAGAYINNAQFEGANIDNTDWTDVIVNKYQSKVLCKVAKGTNPVTGVDTRESLLCPE